MWISPRYDGPAVIDVDGLIPDPAEPLLRQRTRLVRTLAELSGDEWSIPSRCEGWSVEDVALHLVDVNRFWVASFRAGLDGNPTRILASFDPVTIPDALVEAARGSARSATLDALDTTNAELASLLDSLEESEWEKPAETPFGHVALRVAALHALWDAWVHERDVLLPAVREPVVESDEASLALAYAAAAGPAFRCLAGVAVPGVFGVVTRQPETRFTVEVGTGVTLGPEREPVDATIEGDTVSLAEALSQRTASPALSDRDRTLLGGLEGALAP